MKIWFQHKKRAPKEQKKTTKINNLLNGMYSLSSAVHAR